MQKSQELQLCLASMKQFDLWQKFTQLIFQTKVLIQSIWQFLLLGFLVSFNKVKLPNYILCGLMKSQKPRKKNGISYSNENVFVTYVSNRYLVTCLFKEQGVFLSKPNQCQKKYFCYLLFCKSSTFSKYFCNINKKRLKVLRS